MKTGKNHPEKRFELEILEPRVLLSADLLGVGALGTQSDQKLSVSAVSQEDSTPVHETLQASVAYNSADQIGSLFDGMTVEALPSQDPQAEDAAADSATVAVENSDPVISEDSTLVAQTETNQTAENVTVQAEDSVQDQTVSTLSSTPDSSLSTTVATFTVSSETLMAQRATTTLRAGNAPPATSVAVLQAAETQQVNSQSTQESGTVGTPTVAAFSVSVGSSPVLDLLGEIKSQLALYTSGAASGTITKSFGDISLAGVVVFHTVTLTFSGITSNGGTVTIAAASAKLSVGSEVTSTVSSIAGSYEVSTKKFSLTLGATAFAFSSFVKISATSASLTYESASNTTVTVTNGTTTSTKAVSVLTLGVSGATIFAGVNGPASNANAMGVNLANANLALALMSADDGSSYYALKATGGSFSAVGLPDGFTVSATNLQVDVNGSNGSASSTDAVDFTKLSGGKLTVATGASSSVALDFNQNFIKAVGSLDLSLKGFVVISGNIAFQSGGVTSVTLTDGSVKDVTTLMIGASDVTIFAGINGPASNEKAVGVELKDAGFALALFSEIGGTNTYYGLQTTAGSLSAIGLPDGFTLSTTDLEVNVNAGTDGDNVVDFTKFDGGKLTVTTGSSSSAELDFSGSFVKAVGTIEINLKGFVYVQGSMALQLGGVTSVTLSDGSTREVSTLTIGADSLTVFAGINGPSTTNTKAVGVELRKANFAVVLFTPSDRAGPVDNNVYYAVKATAAAVEAVGMPSGITLAAKDVVVEVNSSTDPDHVVVDFSAFDGHNLEVTTSASTSIKLDFTEYFIKAAGHLTLALKGFVYVDGDMALQLGGVTSVTLSDGTTRQVSTLTIGANGLTVFAGINGPSSTNPKAVGVELTNASLALAIFTPLNSLDHNVYYGLKASADSVAGVGMPDGVKLSASNIAVELNTNSDGNPLLPVVDFSLIAGGKLTVATGASTSVDLNFASYYIRAVGEIELAVKGFVYLKGSFAIEQGAVTSVELSDGTTESVLALTIGGDGVTAFAGVNGPSTTNPDATGIELTNVTFALALFTPTSGGSVFYALKATADSVSAVGLPDDLVISGTEIAVDINSGTAPGNLVVDFTKFDGGKLNVLTGPSSSVDFEFDQYLVKAVGTLELNLKGFIYISGSIAFQLGGVTSVTLSDGSTEEVSTLLIGANDVTIFAGVNGPVKAGKSPVGVELSEASFALALFTSNAGGTVYYGLQSSAGKLAAVGLPEGFTLSSTDLRVDLNASNDAGGRVVDFTKCDGGMLTVATGPSTSIDFTYAQAFTYVAGTLDLEINNFVHISGSFSFSNTGGEITIAAGHTAFENATDVNFVLGSTADPFFSATGYVLMKFDAHTFTIVTSNLTVNTKLKIASVIEVDTLSVSLDNVAVDLATGKFVVVVDPVTGDLNNPVLTIAAASAVLFPGNTTITATVTGFNGVFDLRTNAFTITLDKFHMILGSSLTVDATGVLISYDPSISDPHQKLVEIASGTIALTVGGSGIKGAITKLTVYKDGFHFDSLTITKTGAVSFGSFLVLNDPSLTLTDFGMTFSNGNISADISGSITVSVSSGSIMKGSTAFSVAVQNLSITVDLSPANFGDLHITAGKLVITLGQFLTVEGVNIAINPMAGSGETILSIGSISASLNIGSIKLKGTALNLSIGLNSSGNLKLITLPNFGISFAASPSDLNLPSWVGFSITKLGIQWPNFDLDPLNFKLVLSASIGSFKGMPSNVQVSGFVRDVVFDLGALRDGAFPITSVAAFGGSISGNLFGMQVSATILGGIMQYNAEGFEVNADGTVSVPDGTAPGAPGTNDSTVIGKTFYFGLAGSVTVPGVGGMAIRLGISDLGPLTVYISAGIPIILEPNSGIAITNIRGGVDFNASLPSPKDPFDLRSPAFQPPTELTASEWEVILRQQVANQIKTKLGGGNFWDAPVIIRAGVTVYDAYASQQSFRIDGDISIDTTGKILVNGQVVFGDTIKFKMYMFADLSNIASGSVQFTFLMDSPANTPIETIFGTLKFGVTDSQGNPIAMGTIVKNADGTFTQPATAAGFYIQIDGGVQYSALGFATLTISGSLTLTVTVAPVTVKLDVTGTVNVSYLGNLATGTGEIIATSDSSGNPIFWGALKVQTAEACQKLEKVGLFVDGAATLVLNTDSQVHTVNLPDPTDPHNPAKATAVIIEASALSLIVTGTTAGTYAQVAYKDPLSGTSIFNMQGGLSLHIKGLTNAEVYLTVADLSLGPKDVSILSFNGYGLLVVNPQGFAAAMELHLNGPNTFAGMTLTASFTLMMNTTSEEVVFTIPDVLPALPGGGRDMTIPRGPPLADGSIGATGPYVVVTGSGDLALGNLTINGYFRFELSTSEAGPLVSMVVHMSGNIPLAGSATVDGAFQLSKSGVVALLDVTIASSSDLGGGITFQGSFKLAINTTAAAVSSIGANKLPDILAANTVELQASGVLSLNVGGSNGFTISGTLLAITEPGGRTTVSVAGKLDATVGGASLMSGSVTGVLLLLPSGGGVAAKLTLSGGGGPLNGSGVFAFSGSFDLEVNTTGSNQTVPFGLPATPGGAMPTVTIPAGPYARVHISGSLSFGSTQTGFVLGGDFYLEVSPVGLAITATTSLKANVNGSTLLTLVANGAMQITSDGLAAKVTLSAGSSNPFAGTGFSFSGTFLLEINTTGKDVEKIGNTTVNLSATTFLKVAIETATLSLGAGNSGLSLVGNFSLTINPTGIAVAASANLIVTVGGATFLTLSADGGLLITSAGIAAKVNLTLGGGTNALSGAAYKFTGSFTLEVNTTGSIQTVPYAGSTTTVETGLRIHIVGALLFGDESTGFTLRGDFKLSVNSLGLEVAAIASLEANVGGQNVFSRSAEGALQISSAGIAASITITIPESSPIKGAGYTFSGSFNFQVNTTDAAVSVIAGLTVNLAAGHYVQVSVTNGLMVFGEVPAAASVTVEGGFILKVGDTGVFVAATATLKAKVAGESLLTLTANGGLLITASGIAAKVVLTADAGSKIPGSSFFGFSAVFELQLNSTGSIQNVPYGVPSVPGDPIPTTAIAAGPYLRIHVVGDLFLGTLNTGFVLNGQFDLMISSAGLSATASLTFKAKVAGATLMTTNASGALLISSGGVAVSFVLSVSTGSMLSGTGFSFTGNFILKANTTASNLATIGNAVVDLPAGPYVKVAVTNASIALGISGTGLSLDGGFELTISSAGMAATANATLNAKVADKVLLTMAAKGALLITANGIAAKISLSFGGSGSPLAGEGFVFDARVSFELEVNSTSGFIANINDQVVNLAAGPYFRVALSGSLSIASIVKISGSFILTFDSVHLGLEIHASLSVLGIGFSVDGEAGIYTNGIVIDLALRVGGSSSPTVSILGDVITLNGEFVLQVNTTGTRYVPTSGNLPPVEAGTAFMIQIRGAGGVGDASLNIFGFVFTGGMTIKIDTNGFFFVKANLSLDFFGLVTLTAEVYFDSAGHYTIKGSVGVTIGSSGFNIHGTVTLRFSNFESPYFQLRIDGGVTAFGYTFGSIGASFEINGSSVSVSVYVSIDFYFFSVGGTVSFDIGTVDLVSPPVAPVFGSVSGGTLTLDQSVLASSPTQTYVISQSGSTVYIYAPGLYNKPVAYTGVSQIVLGGTGSTDTTIQLDPSVTVPVQITGGSGVDTIIGGSGPVTYTGGTGPSTFIAGRGSNSITDPNGNVTLIATGFASYWLSNTQLKHDGFTDTLSGVKTVLLAAAPTGLASFTVSNFSGAATFDGTGNPSASVNCILETGDLTLNPGSPSSVNSIAQSNGGVITMKNISAVQLTGGSGSNVLTLNGWNGTGDVTLDGAGGSDLYVVNFQSGTSYPVYVDDSGSTGVDNLIANGLSGADTFSITTASVTRGTEVMSYSGIEVLRVNTFDGNDIVNISGTSVETIVTAGNGDDLVNVQAIGAATTVNLGTGTNTIKIGSVAPTAGGTLNNIKALLTLNGSGSETVTLYDTADTSANFGTLDKNSLTGVFGTGGSMNYYGIETLNLNLGSGGNRMLIAGTTAVTTLNAGTGNNTVNVGTVALPALGIVDNIQGALTLLGGGLGTLNVNDTGSTTGKIGTLTSTTLTGLGMCVGGITYSGFTTVKLSLGSGGDTLFINSTANAATTINGNNGNDVIHVRSITGVTTLNTGSGSNIVNVGSAVPGTDSVLTGISNRLIVNAQGVADSLNINNRADAGPGTAILTASTLTGLGMAGGDPNKGIEFYNVETLTLLLGAFNDTVNFRGNQYTTATLIDTGAGSNILNFSSTAGLLTPGSIGQLQGNVQIKGSGTDTMNVDDSGSVTAEVGKLTARSLSFEDPLVISFTGIAVQVIRLSQADDLFTVEDTFTSGSSTPVITIFGEGGLDTFTVIETHASMIINGGAGNDTIFVRGTHAPLAINPDAGINSVSIGTVALYPGGLDPGTLDGIQGPITVAFTGTRDALNVDDGSNLQSKTGVLTASTITGLGMVAGGITYSGAAYLAISLGLNNDTFSIEGSSATENSVIDTGAGTNTVNIGGPGVGGKLLRNIQGPLRVVGSGFDVLNVDDSADLLDTTGQLTDATLTGLTMGASGITYTKLAQLHLLLGSGNDTFTVVNTSSATTTIDANGGADLFNVQATTGTTNLNGGLGADLFSLGSYTPAVFGNLHAILGALNIDGGAGQDSLQLDETGVTDAETGTLTATSITGLGLGTGLVYSTAETLVVNLGSGDDAFNVQSTSAITNTTLNTGGGANTVNLGSAGGTVDLLLGAFTLVGNGNDTLNVDDTGSTSGKLSILLTASKLTGLGAGGITYGGLSALNVSLGSGADVVTLQNTSSAATTFSGNAGTDTFNIRATTGTTTLLGGLGNDQFHLGSLTPATGGNVNSIAGALMVDGADGADVMTVDDTADSAPNSGTLTSSTLTGLGLGDGVTYFAVETLTINLGAGGDTFNVRSTSAATVATLNTGAGVNTVTIGSLASATGGIADLIAGRLILNGSGADTMTVDDSGSVLAKTGILNPTTLLGLGMGDSGITYSGLAALNISLGSGADVFTIANTASTLTTINSNGGADTLNVQATTGELRLIGGAGNDKFNLGSLSPVSGGNVNAIAGRVTIDGGLGSDEVVVDETGEGAVNTGTLTATMLTGLGLGNGVGYGAVETLNLNLGSGSDVFNVQSTSLTTVTTLNTGAGVNLVNIGSPAPVVVNGIQGALIVVGSGNDTMNVNDSGSNSKVGGLTATTLTGMGMGAAGVTYSGLATLNIFLGFGSDTLMITGTSTAETTVNGNDGSDIFNVKATTGITNLNGNAGNDTFNLGSLSPLPGGNVNSISGNLVIDGGSERDTVVVDDAGDTSANTATLTADRLTGMGFGSGVSYAAVETLTIQLGSGDDTFNVQSTNAITRTTVSTGAGVDTIYVGSLSPVTGGLVDGIQGALTVTGSGNDVLNVDDAAEELANTAILTATTLTGLGMGAGGISYSGLSALNVSTGSGNDTVTIQSTSTAVTTVNGNDGADTFNVRATGGVTIVNGGYGNDLFYIGSIASAFGGNVDGIAGALTISGGEGTNTLNVDDSGSTASKTGVLTPTTLTGLGMGSLGITYDAIALLNLSLGSGSDTLTVTNTSSALTTVNGNGGNDTFQIRATTGVLYLNGDAGDDLVHLGSLSPANGGTLNAIAGTVRVDGGAGTDRVYADDSGDTGVNTGRLTATVLSGLGLGGAVTYASVETLDIYLGSGSDIFNVQSTNAATVTTLNTGAGANTVNLGSIAPATGGTVGNIKGALIVVGSGADTLTVDDTASTSGRTVLLTSTKLTGLQLGADGVTYGGLAALNILLGSGADTVTVSSTSTAATTVNGNAGADTFNVRATTGSLNLNGGSGNDTFNLGSASPATTGGNLNAIAGLVGIDGGANTDAVNVDDTLDTVANSGTLTDSMLTGLGMGGGVGYAAVETLSIKLGSGSDSFNVQGTNLATSTTVNTGAGANTVNLGSTAPGSNGIVDRIQGPLTIIGSGNDTMNVDDTASAEGKSGSLTLTTLTGLGMGDGAVLYSGFATLNIFLGAGSDTFTIVNTAAVTTVNGNAGADTFNVRLSTGVTTLNGGTGDDLFNLGSRSPDAAGNVNGIAAVLNVNGGGDADTLNVDDTADISANTGTLTDAALTGLGLGAGVNYAGLEALNINLGSGSDTFNVQSTLSGSVTTLNTGRGANIIHIGSQAPGTGGVLDGIQGSLVVISRAGDTMTIDDTGAVSGKSGELTPVSLSGFGMGSGGITYGSLVALNISLGAGNDALIIVNTSLAATTVNGNDGADTLTVLATTGVTTLNGGNGADVFLVGGTGLGGVVDAINGALTLNGGAGSNTLNVDDTGSSAGKIGTLTSTTLDGLAIGAGGIGFSGMAVLNLGLGSGDDTLTIANTPIAVTTLNGNGGVDTFNLRKTSGVTNVNGGIGNDQFNVGSLSPLGGGNVHGITKALNLNGGSGVDSVNVDDTADATANTGLLTASKLTGLGLGGELAYAGVESLSIKLGAGNDTFNVQSTQAGTETGVNTGGGTNIVNVGSKAPLSTGGLLSGIQGTLTIAGSGADTLNISDKGATVGGSGLLTPTALTGFGMGGGGISFTGLKGLNVWLGAGDDRLKIADLTNSTATLIDGGAGTDAANLAFTGDAPKNFSLLNFEQSAVSIGGNLAGVLNLSGTVGTLTVNGSITTTGQINAGAIDAMTVGDDLAGTLKVTGLLKSLVVTGATQGTISAGSIYTISAGAAVGNTILRVIEGGIERRVVADPVGGGTLPPSVRFAYFYDSTAPGAPQFAVRVTNGNAASRSDDVRFDLSLIGLRSDVQFNLSYVDAAGSSGIRNIAVEGSILKTVSRLALKFLGLPSTAQGGVILPTDSIAGVAVRDSLPVGVIHVAGIKALAFSNLISATGTSLGRPTSLGSDSDIGALWNILGSHASITLTDDVFRVPAGFGHQVSLYFVKDSGRDFDGVLTFGDQLSGGKYTALVQVNAAQFQHGSLISSINILGDGASVTCVVGIANLISTGALGDILTTGSPGLGNITAPGIFGNIKAHNGGIFGDITTTGIRIDPLTGKQTSVNADIGRTLLGPTGNVIGTTLINSERPMTGDILCGGRLISQLIEGTAL